MPVYKPSQFIPTISPGKKQSEKNPSTRYGTYTGTKSLLPTDNTTS